jgi:two-component system sensor histidine kinase VanS
LNETRYYQKLTRRIFARFFLALVVYSTALVVLFIAAKYFLSSFIWHWTDFLYPLLNFINNNSVAFLLICWLIGVLIIFLHYWSKTLSYLDKIVNAAEIFVSQEEEYTHLPPELIEVEEKMNRMKSEATRNARLAKEAEQRKNDLIVYLAHDLKTPLTSVLGYLTLLRDEQQISDELRRKYLSVSLEKAQRLEDLINEFFEITRFNLTQLTLELGKVNLSRMLEQLTHEFYPMFAEKNLTCTLNVPPDFEVRFDVNKMARVFDNLLRNAIIYSFENSVINIVVEQNGGFNHIWFINEGNTIPKEKLERIFERFYRLDASRASNTGGAGLGLAIAREIVELHGGIITATSANDKIVFSVTIPIL